MTDGLTQTAFRIADEASRSLVKCNALHIDAWTYALTADDMQDEAMDEAVTYLVQRGRAGRHCLAARVDEEVRHG